MGSYATIDLDELAFDFTRASGPGGQNVNKVSTRVTLRFDLDGSPSLTARQKSRIREALATRISQDGILRVVASRHRTQAANREAAIDRFVELLTEALRPRKRRKKTTVPAAAKRRRREQKTQRSATKQNRAWKYGGQQD